MSMIKSISDWQFFARLARWIYQALNRSACVNITVHIKFNDAVDFKPLTQRRYMQ
jgi:hypothetical protein